MNVGEIRAALAAYPDDMPVAVIDPADGELDTYVSVDEALNHPGSRPGGGKAWHWKTDTSTTAAGTPVLVLY